MKKLALIIGLALTAQAAVLEIENGTFDTNLDGWIVDGQAVWDNGQLQCFDVHLYQTVQLGGSAGDWTVSFDYSGAYSSMVAYAYYKLDSEPWAMGLDWFYTAGGGTASFTIVLDGHSEALLQFNTLGGPQYIDNIAASFDPAHVPPSLPEPAGGLAFAFVGLAWAIRRNRK